MAANNPPFVEQNLSHSAQLVRQELQSGLPFGSVGGVVPTQPVAGGTFSDLQVSAGSGMQVLLNPGSIYIPGSLGSSTGYAMPTGYPYQAYVTNGGSAPSLAAGGKRQAIIATTQGGYFCYNDDSSGQVPLTIATASATFPRIDVVYAAVADAQYSGSTNAWAPGVQTGTAAASPTVPAIPASALPLALVWVPANASSITTIIDLRAAFNANPYRASMYRNAAYTGTSGIFPFDTVVTDPAGMCTTGSSAGFTVPVSGYYQVNSLIVQTPVSGSRYGLSVWKNGAALRNGDFSSPNGTNLLGVGLSTALLCAAGDILTIQTNAPASTVYSVGQINAYADCFLLSPA